MTGGQEHTLHNTHLTSCITAVTVTVTQPAKPTSELTLVRRVHGDPVDGVRLGESHLPVSISAILLVWISANAVAVTCCAARDAVSDGVAFVLKWPAYVLRTLLTVMTLTILHPSNIHCTQNLIPNERIYKRDEEEADDHEKKKDSFGCRRGGGGGESREE